MTHSYSSDRSSEPGEHDAPPAPPPSYPIPPQGVPDGYGYGETTTAGQHAHRDEESDGAESARPSEPSGANADEPDQAGWEQAFAPPPFEAVTPQRFPTAYQPPLQSPPPSFGEPPAPQQQPYPQQPYAQQPYQPYQQQPHPDQAYQQPPQQQGPPTVEHPPPGFAPHQPQPAPVPRPEDLLVPDRTPIGAEPASEGWRGRVNRMSGGLIKTRANDRELQLRQAITDIQRGFSRPMTVVVVQPKGGAGKTPTTICLSAAFGAYRGGYVVGWDDNETRGTLSVRVSNPDSQRATVWDLLSDLQQFERFDARVGDLGYYVRPQPDAHFDALVSDDNPGNMAQIGETEYKRLHTVLQRFYRMIVVDTGNNVRSPNWQAAVNSADLVVVVSTYQRDVGYSGSWVLDHLAQTGREYLARNSMTVLTAADPSTDKEVRDQLLQHFVARTRAVCEIPYDPELAHGGPIRWNALAPETRNAWILAGATVAGCLAEHDQRTLDERRA